MAFFLKVRDLFMSPGNVLKEVKIKAGAAVLDFGCGPGRYIPALAERVGPEGRIYALDIHPLASRIVRKLADKKGIPGLKTIVSDCATGLPDESIDLTLLFDILHALDDPGPILAEISRVLKPEGILSVSDHHLKQPVILDRIGRSGLFEPVQKGLRVVNFGKKNRS